MSFSFERRIKVLFVAICTLHTYNYPQSMKVNTIYLLTSNGRAELMFKRYEIKMKTKNINKSEKYLQFSCMYSIVICKTIFKFCFCFCIAYFNILMNISHLMHFIAQS